VESVLKKRSIRIIAADRRSPFLKASIAPNRCPARFETQMGDECVPYEERAIGPIASFLKDTGAYFWWMLVPFLAVSVTHQFDRRCQIVTQIRRDSGTADRRHGM
jgi:hypothetical protein